MSAKFNDLVYEMEEAERRREPERDKTRPKSAAEMMLARNAGAPLDSRIKTNITFSPNPHPIERIGSVFIDTIFYLLNYWECPAPARDIALAICGLSGGRVEYFKLTQKQIGERLGVEPRTVREKLRILTQWEQDKNVNIIQIKEQEWNPIKKQYDTTEYRPLMVRFAADYIRERKERGLPPVSRHALPTEKEEEVIDEVADRIYSEVPEAPRIKRKEKNVTPKQTKINFIENRQERIRRDFQDLRNDINTQSYDPNEIWKETMLIAEKAFFGVE